MLSYCLMFHENTGIKNPKFARKAPGRIMLLSKSAVCGSKKSILSNNKKLADY